MKLRNSKQSCAILFAACLLGMLLGSGCGSRERIAVRIVDRQYETELKAELHQTVRELLSEAEISLNEGDTVLPGLEETIDENNARIVISRQVQVSVMADGQERKAELAAGTVEDALHKAGIKLGRYDAVNHDLKAYLTQGMNICVFRRVGVTIVADKKSKKLVTGAATVREVLKEQGVKLGKKDKLSHKESDKLTEGMRIVVKRVETREEVSYESIAFSTQTKSSSGMYVGTSRVTQEGKKGSKKITYEIHYVDGREKSRKVIKEEVIKEPVSKIIVQGTKKKAAAGDSNIVSKEKVYDCDGSGHGYYIITYRDGSVKYVDF